MKVIVDPEMCEAYGQCVMIAPQVFDLGDEDETVRILDSEPDETLRTLLEDAVDSCPVNALTIED